MRVFFGMILGALLTVAAAYVYDASATAPSTTGSAANTSARRQMVNWEVVGENFRVVRERAQDAWSTLSQKVAS